MTLNEYMKALRKLVKEHPEAKNFQVVYARDDEGNGFQVLHYAPGIGSFDEESRDFHDMGDIKALAEETDWKETDFPINAVCVN